MTHDCARPIHYVRRSGTQRQTTQLRLLGERLRKAGQQVLETQEPGGTPIGVQIRHVLLDAKNRELCPTAELLLMFASRAQLVREVIEPALDAGRWA